MPTVIICGPRDDPNDPLMEYDNYFGHVPKDFNPRTGRSKTHYQVRIDDRYVWQPKAAPHV